MTMVDALTWVFTKMKSLFLFLAEYPMDGRNTFHPFFQTNLQVKLFANLRYLISRNIRLLTTVNLLRYY